ncbi:ATP-grasp domain-containing protein [Maridesulfovibrio hydrothermalis]|uniref:ATP-grasp domain-containing protein n=1 Tax=Maridesulfovibrio hydrothermalis AM13 = DSM 14728 TaxID=1121451 RepID=L0R7X6_9BACT|nr:ATP-grasp domain-containing protein [Maridesulfovibrio hydrothermalis]CCO22300.1 protein of unknown function [Maridesulfovibrio hydrothermalis AM13 = DSM 14728]
MRKFNKTIVFPNVHEVVRRSMPWKTFDNKFLKKLRAAGSAYSEFGILWGGDNKTVVLPKPIPNVQLDYIKELLGYKNIEIIITDPNQNQGEICCLSNDVVSHLENYDTIYCLFWGASPEAYSMVSQMKSLGFCIESPDIPQESVFRQVELFDSKSRFRKHLSCENIDFGSLNFKIAKSYEEVPSILMGYVEAQIPCVVKSEFGVGGYGNIFISKEMILAGYENCLKNIEEAVNFAPYISSNEIVFEDMVESGFTICDTISGLGVINPGGACSIIGVVKEIRASGYYRGAQTVTDKDAKLIAEKTMEIGAIMSKYGYRGYFCIDCIVNFEGKAILLEINARRCASHFIFEIGNRLFSSQYYAQHYLSVPITYLGYETEVTELVINIFDKITNIETDIVAIPTQVSGLTDSSPYIGYLVLGGNSNSVESACQKVVYEFEQNKIIIGEAR